MSDETVTYILDLKNGEKRKVTIPKAWKVTFGPLVPGTKYEQRPAFRVYESKDLQRAVFTDVESFRIDSIPIMERVTSTKVQNLRKSTSDGDKIVQVEARVSEWIDPDAEREVSDEYLRIESLEDD